ncbi:Uncharacterised protein [Bordetella pertussis]|nr:Uncharacterised protein [Bordetella pertussis]
MLRAPEDFSQQDFWCWRATGCRSTRACCVRKPPSPRPCRADCCAKARLPPS